MIAALLAPVVVVVDFTLHRDRIAAELCVQRDVPEGERRCHGQCFLMKQLDKLEQRTEELPTTLRNLKLDDVVLAGVPALQEPFIQVLDAVRGRMCAEGAVPGFPWCSEPVPWC